jgi:hypothetical protein
MDASDIAEVDRFEAPKDTLGLHVLHEPKGATSGFAAECVKKTLPSSTLTLTLHQHRSCPRIGRRQLQYLDGPSEQQVVAEGLPARLRMFSQLTDHDIRVRQT